MTSHEWRLSTIPGSLSTDACIHVVVIYVNINDVLMGSRCSRPIVTRPSGYGKPLISNLAEVVYQLILLLQLFFLSRYFEQKVAAVQAATGGATAPVFPSPDHPDTQFSCFQSIGTVDVVATVRRLPDKTSAVDPLPVNLLKQVVEELAPYLTELFNRSLALGQFPDVLYLILYILYILYTLILHHYLRSRVLTLLTSSHIDLFIICRCYLNSSSV